MRASVLYICVIACYLVAALQVGCGNFSAGQHSALPSDSAVRGLAYESMREMYRRIATVNQWVNAIDYGFSAEGHELFVVTISDPNFAFKKNRPTLLVTEAIHGNEYLGLGERLPRWILNQRNSPDLHEFFSSGGAIFVVPIFNPDGYEYHRRLTTAIRKKDGQFDRGNSWGRTNGNKRDLNRDFPVPSLSISIDTALQPETLAITSFLDEKVALGFDIRGVIDYHCCMGPKGTLLYPFGYSRSALLPASFAQDFKSHADIFRDHMAGIRTGPVNSFINYEAPGGSGDYYFERFGALAFAFEGRQSGEVKRLENHGRAIAALALSLSRRQLPTHQPSYPNIGRQLDYL